MQKKIRIGDLLIQHRVITEQQLKAALAEQKRSGRKLGKTLIDLGYLSEDALLDFLSRQLAIPFIDLKTFQLDPATARRLPETHARRFRTLILKETEAEFLVGMADPTDIFAFDELTRILPKPVREAVVREADLLASIDRIYRRTKEINNLAEELDEEIGEDDFDLAQLAADTESANAPVVKLLQTLFEDAVQVQASDIHIEPDENVLRVRQRVDGVLQEHVMKEKRIAPALVLRLKLMAGLNISEKRLPQDGRFNIKVKGRSIDVRVSTMPIQHGESVVMRLLDQAAGILDLTQLGMPDEVRRRFERLIAYPHGMVLVTGPTGSGKSTTLYAALNRLNQVEQKVITVEDPVEYRLPRVNQVQVHERIGLTFARVLRAALRQDPDVVMVGEMRDQETAEIGLRAAVTGHLVLSTLHTNDAVTTAIRLIDMGAESHLLAASLRGIVAQRLMRRICQSCCADYSPSAQERSWLVAVLGADEAAELCLFAGKGCTHCNNSGYRGRVGVYELLEVDAAMADALRRADQAEFARAAAASAGYRPLTHAALDYAKAGVTTLAEVFRVAGAIDESFLALPIETGDEGG
ncbi:MSHA biogenesis protein MshE [Alkalilimnicola ehrlichii]|uniref:MSHA biogenesis protein MshE n=1 Tax=Alkalilimnicola ehrlichii TaxID=351052 RepID=A0A3E0WSC1_9GAMM|nr:GspE/PulE family protein [Alkalilimnicola ehrlichii]RFA28285.1 MSHA biogenesis protein MshE [Alkalilimnicola ehrlichii]RFA34885.1 MSHA biogenesis protein MshE [Alkalilimnicola ehrlichii]